MQPQNKIQREKAWEYWDLMPYLADRCCIAVTSEYALQGRDRKRRPMIGCDTAIFTDPDDYRMSVPGLRIRLVLHHIIAIDNHIEPFHELQHFEHKPRVATRRDHRQPRTTIRKPP